MCVRVERVLGSKDNRRSISGIARTLSIDSGEKRRDEEKKEVQGIRNRRKYRTCKTTHGATKEIVRVYRFSLCPQVFQGHGKPVEAVSQGSHEIVFVNCDRSSYCRDSRFCGDDVPFRSVAVRPTATKINPCRILERSRLASLRAEFRIYRSYTKKRKTVSLTSK